MKASRWVVFLEIEPSFVDGFEAAKKLGLEVLYLSKDPDRCNAAAPLASKTALLSAHSTQAAQQTLRVLPTDSDIAGVWALKDSLIPLAGKLNRAFGSNQNAYPEALIAATKNKYLMRLCLKRSRLNPAYRLVAAGTTGPHPFPKTSCVIKPLNGYSSIGVEKVFPNGDFSAAAARTVSTLAAIQEAVVEFDPPCEADPLRTLLVEEYIDGEEFSVELFADAAGLHCIGCCGKSAMDPPFFEEISYCFPARLSEQTRRRLEKAALEAARALGLKSGMTHMEFRVTADREYLLDVGLRLGGSGLTHSLVQTSAGMPLVEHVLAELCRLPSPGPLSDVRGDLSLLYLVQVGGGGRVKQTVRASPAELRQRGIDADIVKTQFFVQPGDRLQNYPSYSGHPGYVLFRIPGRTSHSYRTAERLLRLAPGLFHIAYSSANLRS